MRDLRLRVGRAIRERRRQLSWKLAVVAALMEVREHTVSRWESGDRGLDLDTLYRLAAVLRCDPRDLLPEPSADAVTPARTARLNGSPFREADSLCLRTGRAVGS